jgi:hypothetical protein
MIASISTIRSYFEEFADDCGLNLDRNSLHEYASAETKFRWAGWVTGWRRAEIYAKQSMTT